MASKLVCIDVTYINGEHGRHIQTGDWSLIQLLQEMEKISKLSIAAIQSLTLIERE